MAIINWNENLSVKIESIDNQHKHLIGLINSFYESLNTKDEKEKTLELIRSLKAYTLTHFTLEERLMKQTEYPFYKYHKEQHDIFIATVSDFEDRFQNDKLLLTIEITKFLKNWVSDHIMYTDKRYSDFFIKNGIK